MISLCQIPFYHEIGIECSGTITAIDPAVTELHIGYRVCALANGCYASFIRTSQDFVIRIPQDMGFAHCASIPVVFFTAY